MRNRVISAIVAAALVLVVAGCPPGTSRQHQPEVNAAQKGDTQEVATRLRLYCGAGIRPPVAQMCKEFEKEHNVRIETDYSGSNILLSRIKLRQEGDLYMPGDIRYVKQAEKDGFIASYREACYFIPTIMVRKGNPKDIQGLADLAGNGVRVGLGDPEACAIGKVTEKILEKSPIAADQIEPNVKFRSMTVNELGVQIKAGKLDAAIVWDAIARGYPDTADLVQIAPESNIISTIPVAVLSFSEHPDLAGQFAEFVTSDRGQQIFREHNYTVELPE